MTARIPSRRRRRSAMDTSRMFYLFISPWLIGFICFTAGPMLYSLYAAFSKWNGVSAPNFTGLKNIQTMLFQDSLFWKSVGNTFKLRHRLAVRHLSSRSFSRSCSTGACR